MMRHKIHYDGWSSAMEPSFVGAPAHIERVAYAQKVRDAAELRALVEAHIAAGGAFDQLSSNTTAKVSG